MNEIIVIVNGKKEMFGTIWVHLQTVKFVDSAPYKFEIPLSYAKDIFYPYEAMESTAFLPDFIKKEIDELGTFIVEGYIDGMMKIMKQRKCPYRWVIATVESICIKNEFIEMAGRALPFQPRG